jgi:inosine-uridine nucleoside N-ribohydrolase
MQAKHKVIFDTDLASMTQWPCISRSRILILMSLVSPLLSATCMSNRRLSMRSMTRIAGRTIPVAQGVNVPFAKAAGTPPDFIHGADGLNLPSRIEVGGKAEVESAAEFIVKMARQHPGEITLVAVGPLGNLGLALKMEPQLPKLLKKSC